MNTAAAPAPKEIAMTATMIEIPALFLDPEALATAPSLTEHGQHEHGLGTIAGYVVRQSVRRGETQPETYPGRPGPDVATFIGATSYASALELARHMRRPGGKGPRPAQWAVVDTIYNCGCRS